MDPGSYIAARNEVLTLLGDGRVLEAFHRLHPLLAYPGRLESRIQWRDAMSVLGRVERTVSGDTIAVPAAEVAEDVDDAHRLFRLGRRLIERDLPDIAATVLRRAHGLVPDDEPVLTELAIALEGAGLHAEACGVLRRAPVHHLERSAFCRYLLAFNTVMQGDLGEARRLVQRIRPGPHDDDLALRMEAMLDRAGAVSGVTALDTDDLRGWHLLLNGGLLLHRSPHDTGRMRGRYATVWDHWGLCHEGIRRVRAVLDVLDLWPPRVVAAPDRDSAILAAAAGTAMGLEVAAWEDGHDQPGLVVVYDLHGTELLRSFPDVPAALAIHRPHQVLWSHAGNWQAPRAYTPDVTTLLYRHVHPPWAPRIRGVDPETGRARYSEPAQGTVDHLARRILAAPADESEAAAADLRDLLAVAARSAAAPPLARPGILRQEGPRSRQWVGGPVTSDRWG